MSKQKQASIAILNFTYLSKKNNVTCHFCINDNSEFGANVSYDYSPMDISGLTIKSLKKNYGPLSIIWNYFADYKTLATYLKSRMKDFFIELDKCKEIKSKTEYLQIYVLMTDKTIINKKMTLQEFNSHPHLVKMLTDVVPEEAEFPTWVKR